MKKYPLGNILGSDNTQAAHLIVPTRTEVIFPILFIEGYEKHFKKPRIFFFLN